MCTWTCEDEDANCEETGKWLGETAEEEETGAEECAAAVEKAELEEDDDEGREKTADDIDEGELPCEEEDPTWVTDAESEWAAGSTCNGNEAECVWLTEASTWTFKDEDANCEENGTTKAGVIETAEEEETDAEECAAAVEKAELEEDEDEGREKTADDEDGAKDGETGPRKLEIAA